MVYGDMYSNSMSF